MKLLKLTIIATALFGMSACTSYIEGEMRGSYTPVAIGTTAKNNHATIKTASGISIWQLNGKRLVNPIAVMITGGHKAITVPEGYHSLSCHRGRDLFIKKTHYKAGHEYFIDYLEVKSGSSRTFYYWVKDLTENKIITGKEITPDDLKK